MLTLHRDRCNKTWELNFQNTWKLASKYTQTVQYWHGQEVLYWQLQAFASDNSPSLAWSLGCCLHNGLSRPSRPRVPQSRQTKVKSGFIRTDRHLFLSVYFKWLYSWRCAAHFLPNGDQSSSSSRRLRWSGNAESSSPRWRLVVIRTVRGFYRTLLHLLIW